MKERKWLKWVVLFLLALLIAVPAVGTKEAQAATKTGICGSKATWKLNTKTGKLTISGSGALSLGVVDEGEDVWNGYASKVKSIVIGDKITSIGDFMYQTDEHYAAFFLEENWCVCICSHVPEDRHDSEKSDEHQRRCISKLHQADEIQSVEREYQF